MVRQSVTRFAVRCALCLALAVSAFAQYGGGTGGGMGGATGSSGVYTPPKGGYGSSTGIAVGAAAAAAGAGIVAYLALHNRPAAVGCVEQSSEGSKLVDEKDKKTYKLVASNDVVLSPGERVSL